MSEIGVGMGMWMLWMLLMAVAVLVVPFWFIFSKAGYPKWLALLMIVPLINVFLLYFLALAKWPNPGPGRG